jgi:hypothetical protein
MDDLPTASYEGGRRKIAILESGSQVQMVDYVGSQPVESRSVWAEVHGHVNITFI